MIFQTREALKAAEHHALGHWACHPFAPLAEYESLRAENERLREDAEHWERRLEIARMGQMRAESMRDGYFEVLMGIHHLLAPADAEANGKIYRFAPQDTTLCMAAWREMSRRIREIPEALAKARAARQEEG